ncbi:MAG: hypothetical protein ACP5PQ_05180 [Thermoproteota archaeon]
MNAIKNHTKELIVLTILLALAVSVVNAAVFVYYPISITAQYGPRPVYFDEGTNAGRSDVGAGNTITVSLSDDDTYASITVNPSRRGTTRYKDVLRIVNNDTQAYYIGFTVDTAFDDSAITNAELIVRTTGGAMVGTVDLKSSGTTWVPWLLSAKDQLRIDLRFTISSRSSGSDSASITLVYSPQSSESPP